MLNNLDGSLILLTYKGKVLLLLENSTPLRSAADMWCFIEAWKKQGESFEEAIHRRVARITHIKLSTVALLSHWVYNQKKKYFYHASLTDEDVNNIQRDEGQTIDFFSLRELDRLNLARLTKLFIGKHRDLLEKMPTNAIPHHSVLS